MCVCVCVCEPVIMGPPGVGKNLIHDAFKASQKSSNVGQRLWESNLQLLFNVSNVEYFTDLKRPPESFTLILETGLHVMKTHYLFFTEQGASGFVCIFVTPNLND